jgi:hypothetical protein
VSIKGESGTTGGGREGKGIFGDVDKVRKACLFSV